MTWKEYKEYMKDEWEFHKRHPEMFLVWLCLIVGTAAAFID